MLVLDRHEEEQIVVGDGPDAIVITVCDISGGRVRLGIAAPRETPIYRREILPPDHPLNPLEALS